MKKQFPLFLIPFLCFSILKSQTSRELNSSEILQGLKKLNTVSSVLYVAAHPDDENRPLLAYLSRVRNYRTGYLSVTRGDGGQNEIGPEFGEKHPHGRAGQYRSEFYNLQALEKIMLHHLWVKLGVLFPGSS